MSGPRILAIMGSGETAPTMAKVHRALFERFGDEPVPAAIIDTTYGFQENADELSARTVDFFGTSVGRVVSVASFRSRDVDAVTQATAVARIREARYLMAGPGSPSYALRQWVGGPIPAALADKLAGGGIVTMASAAALTLGLVTIPVYEVYKVGEDPRWLEGLDLLGSASGLRAAVVPHFDNAEGGNHDTRYCYMGERRMRILERALPEGAFVLGVDGHTALVLDLEQGTASVAGLGSVTVRAAGRSLVVQTGSEVPIEALGEAARRLAVGGEIEVPETPTGGGPGRAGHRAEAVRRPDAPLHDAVAELEGSVIEALGRDDARAVVGFLLDLDSTISGRIRSGEDSPDLDNASATFRALIARLGERAAGAERDPRALLEPLVGALLDLRAEARAAHDWTAADRIRDRLAAAGVEIRDRGGGSTWTYDGSRGQPAGGAGAG